jgi:hypothetical protein
MDDHTVLDTFDQRLDTYLAAHPEADDDAVLAYAELLQTATPGLRDALDRQRTRAIAEALLVCPDAHGYPRLGPRAQPLPSGERTNIPYADWGLADYRLNIAWWWRYPDPAHRVARQLLAEAQRRWPDADLTPRTWPDIADLPAWEAIAPHVEQLRAAGLPEDPDEAQA